MATDTSVSPENSSQPVYMKSRMTVPSGSAPAALPSVAHRYALSVLALLARMAVTAAFVVTISPKRRALFLPRKTGNPTGNLGSSRSQKFLSVSRCTPAMTRMNHSLHTQHVCAASNKLRKARCRAAWHDHTWRSPGHAHRTRR